MHEVTTLGKSIRVGKVVQYSLFYYQDNMMNKLGLTVSSSVQAGLAKAAIFSYANLLPSQLCYTASLLAML
jgi:hypothetical protein